MLLHEEYFRRHNLKIPIFEYTDSINLILRTSDSRWALLTSRWREQYIHPGYYHVRYLSPVHNGFLNPLSRNSSLFREIDCSHVYWDQYEDYIFRWIDGPGSKLKAVSKEEAALASWEMFLYCYDDLIASYFCDDLGLAIEHSTRPDISLTNRKKAFLAAHRLLPQDVIEQYANYLLPYTNNYSTWLARLVNK